jgi:hypothetical protein
LGGIDLIANDAEAILRDAEVEGCRTADHQIQLCGMRMNLVAP